jgi:hypothetical protein
MKKFSDRWLDGWASLLFGFFILAIVIGELFKSLFASFGVYMIIRGIRVFEAQFTQSSIDKSSYSLFSAFHELFCVPSNKCNKDEKTKD